MDSDHFPHSLSPRNRILSIDGGGIRGYIPIAILTKLEKDLRDHYKKPNLVLSDYFNFIGGTSVGAIMAAMLSVGKSMKEVHDLFEDSSKEMFQGAFLSKTRMKYRSTPLQRKLIEEFGEDRVLGDPDIKSFLMIVLRNATSGSTWGLTNNPGAHYNDLAHTHCNLKFPLWQLVRASTAAPTYFPVERLRSSTKTDFHEFVDGGVSPHNNPAFAMFLQATLPEYRLNMPVGADRLLLVSVGTGNDTPVTSPGDIAELDRLGGAVLTLKSLMHSASEYQDMLCRVFGRYANPTDRSDARLDSELAWIREESNLTAPERKAFTYFRYNPKLTNQDAETFRDIYRYHVGPWKKKPWDLDAVAAKDLLFQIGEKYAREVVCGKDFGSFLGGLHGAPRRIVDEQGVPQPIAYYEKNGDIPVPFSDEEACAKLEPNQPLRFGWKHRANKCLILGVGFAALTAWLWIQGWAALFAQIGSEETAWSSEDEIKGLVFGGSLLLAVASFLTGVLLIFEPRKRLITFGRLIAITLLAFIGLIKLGSTAISTVVPGRLQGPLPLLTLVATICLIGTALARFFGYWKTKKDRELAEKSQTPEEITENPIAEKSERAVAKTSTTETQTKGTPPLEVTFDQSLDIALNESISMSFQPIPAGKFRMGSRGYRPDEEPIHVVTIPEPFFMGTYPVTQEQFAVWTSEHLPEHKNRFPGNPQHPAENMSWFEAMEFCRWLTKQLPSGIIATLPDEARWEYACRAEPVNDGTFVGSEYHTGNGTAALEKAGWFYGNSGMQTRPTGALSPNLWNLYDMHGNVYEWCNDVYLSDAYLREDAGAALDISRELPIDTSDSRGRVRRGGSWVVTAAGCRSSYRVGDHPGSRIGYRGFRVCLVPGPVITAEPEKGNEGGRDAS